MTMHTQSTVLNTFSVNYYIAVQATNRILGHVGHTRHIIIVYSHDETLTHATSNNASMKYILKCVNS